MMKKKIAALLLAETLAVAPSYAVMAENASATEAPAEENKEPVKDGTYDLKCSEDDKDEDAIQLHFSNEVRNDVTGNWRIATLASDKSFLDFALAYYKEFVTSKDEIHAVVNFTDQTTTKISDAPISGYVSVTVHKYVDGEEHDAKLLFGGEVTGDYWIDVETGEVEDLNAEESE